MLQFCKCPAGGGGQCKWQLKIFCFLLLKCISTFKGLSQSSLVAKFNVIPPNPKFKNTCGFQAILCSHLEGEEYVFLFITGWAQPSHVKRLVGREQFCLLDTNSIYKQPEQSREATWGRRKDTADGSNLPQKKCFKNKNENKANLSFPLPSNLYLERL